MSRANISAEQAKAARENLASAWPLHSAQPERRMDGDGKFKSAGTAHGRCPPPDEWGDGDPGTNASSVVISRLGRLTTLLAISADKGLPKAVTNGDAASPLCRHASSLIFSNIS